MVIKSSVLCLSAKKPLLFGCVFLLIYALGQFIIATQEWAPASYSLYTLENSYRVLLVSISVILAAVLQKNEKFNFELNVNIFWLITCLSIVMPVTLFMCYLYPWGVFGQELTVGHSLKSIFRHCYFVLSLITIIVIPRSALILIPIDIVMLLLDPSRVFFVEAFFPKIYFLYIISNFYAKLKIILMSTLSALVAMLIQSTRLGDVRVDFINFAIFSDIVHSTYPALQLSQFSIDLPWSSLFSVGDFEYFYGETLAPLGGFFFPGTFLLSGVIWIDCVLAFLASYFIFRLLITWMSSGLNIIAMSGITFLFQKFPVVNTFKLLIAITFFTWFFRIIGLYKVRIHPRQKIKKSGMSVNFAEAPT